MRLPPGKLWLLIAVVWFVTLAAWCSRQSYPPLPAALDLTITFPVGTPGRAEPLIATGVFEAAEFFVVTYIDERTLDFSYDYWGVGGPRSQPIPFVPGKPHALRVEMPSLAELSPPPRAQRPLRIVFDGREVLRQDVPLHRREPEQCYFGENPIGGTTAGVDFRGRITTKEGRVLRGDPSTYFSVGRRWVTWVRAAWWHLPTIGLASVVAAFLTCRVPWRRAWSRWRAPAPRTLIFNAKSSHALFAATALVCVTVFGALTTDGTFRLFDEESFGSFYEFQAASLLQGRLDVDEKGIVGEAFVVNGKHYGYFGVTPALLRLPFAHAATLRGKLSRSYMLGYYALSLVAAYLLLCHATRVIGGEQAFPSRFVVVLFTLMVGLGSTLLFLGARAYVYHEAILCGAMFSLWSAYGALRFLAMPSSRWWILGLSCGVLAVHARPPTGLFALTLVGVVAANNLWHATKPCLRDAVAAPAALPWRRHLVIGVLCVLGVASFNGVSYLKFRTFDGSPLRYSVQYDAKRLARFDGRNFHLANLGHNTDIYLFRPAFTITRGFPYFYFGSPRAPRSFPRARIDMVEPTLALPFVMPALFLLGLSGAVVAAWNLSALRRPLLIVWLSAAPMLLAMFTAVVISHRYTGDFCPLLILSAAFAVAAMDLVASRARWVLLALSGVLVCGSIAANAALALHFRGEIVWGVTDETKRTYQKLRQRVDAFFQPAPPPAERPRT